MTPNWTSLAAPFTRQSVTGWGNAILAQPFACLHLLSHASSADKRGHVRPRFTAYCAEPEHVMEARYFDRPMSIHSEESAMMRGSVAASLAFS